MAPKLLNRRLPKGMPIEPNEDLMLECLWARELVGSSKTSTCGEVE